MPVSVETGTGPGVRGLGILLAAVVLSLCIGCRPSPPVSDSEAANAGETPADMIGTVRMGEDGSLILRLAPESVGGSEGDVRIVLPPDHEDYASYLERIGELEPGESKRLSSLPKGEP